MTRKDEEDRFRNIFTRLHEGHDRCRSDEWLGESCAIDGTPIDRPIVWSRRNGPWKRVDILWVGAAPGNAGGRGAGDLGAHGTRIPFGGDISGANLEVMLGAIGVTRNETFIAAALNELPAKGGGEPSVGEILAPCGGYPDSVVLLRDTILAAGPSLIVALGNVAARVVATAWLGHEGRLTGPAVLRRAGWTRHGMVALRDLGPACAALRDAWQIAWRREPDPAALWLTHPSAQNMSPHARVDTQFHGRMVKALATLRRAVSQRFGRELPERRPAIPKAGIYALPEWRTRIEPRIVALDRLWREKGV